MTSVIGVDLGGTKTAAALVASDGVPGPMSTAATPATAGPAAVLDAVARLVADVATAHRLTALTGLGVGTAGVVDTTSGTILSATDALPGWPGTEVAAGVRARLATLLPGTLAPDAPLHVCNDVDAHAAGEAWRGAGAGRRSMLMVAIGTGIGASLVLDGIPLRGAHHVAGEMGHMPSIDAQGLRCGCGRLGHLEALGSGPALHRAYLARGGDTAVRDTRGVVERATLGEGVARETVAASATAVGRAIAGVVTVMDPEVVVLGGGMSEAGPLWWQPLEDTLRGELIAPLAAIVLRRSTLGAPAAVIGAARQAMTDPRPTEEP